MTSKGGVTLGFDAKNQLLSLPGMSYAYDAAGRRVRKSVNGTETYYFYSQAGQLLHQWEPAINKSTNFYQLGRRTLARGMRVGTGTPTIIYSYTDAQNTPLMRADAQGAVTATFDYTPYGQVALGAPPNGAGYTGHVNDPESGLVYMQQRYYDPVMGRFLSVDPITAYQKPLTNFNRYIYALNNPYRFTDPDGRDSVGEMIDSAAEGCGAVSCAGWAIARGVWGVFGAEGVSQVYDKGAEASTGDKVMAGIEVGTLGLGGKVGAGFKAISEVASFARVAKAEALISRLTTMGNEGSKGVREVAGTAKDAKKMFDTLRAGNPVKEVKSGVFTAEGAKGGTVTFRAESKSGPPTVDVNGVVDGVRKIKFLGD